ncbi:hypothetical protein GCM10020358_38870 [Amorphoplanes nipponensis]|uniref:Uncharacterized protein n=1 Tax=Actinoplanes nipponensis TaxID=135950 RepID=A0A919JC78_9ACTN|nr:hypothetical protein [Actinoplanes nipponensis]GIE48314.1 hypothetical protein Ani05nite_18480 [Actinoplanes nipponensis]
MGATRDRLLARQAELRVRHDALGGLGAEPPHDPALLAQVFAGTDELMTVVEELAAATARRRVVVALALLGVAAAGAVLVAFGVLPAYWLLAVLALLVTAVLLWLTTRAAPSRAGP